MGLLAPLFLLGLAAIAVPVIIHMIQRERKEVLEFPSLMFVRKIPFHSFRRQRIRHWFLLLLRCAALALLMLAFARPFFRAAALAAVTDGAREVVILLESLLQHGGTPTAGIAPRTRHGTRSTAWQRTTARP